MRSRSRILLALAVAAILSPATADAQGGYVSTDRLGYTGTVTRFGSQADALSNTNGTTYAWPQRDLNVYFVDNNAAFSGGLPSYAYFLNVWWPNGGNTPSNSNNGLIQLADNGGETVTSQSYTWTDNARTSFAFAAAGGNSVYGCSGSGDCGRLFNGTSMSSAVIFHNYLIALNATGLTPATFNATTGVWESTSEPGSVSGSMSGLVQNVSIGDPGSNGWYTYDLSINGTSFASQNYSNDLGDSVFGSAVTVTPEPASMMLFATGLVGVAFMRRRKNC